MSRKLAGTVIIDGVDDEYWPFADEKVHKTFTIDMVIDEAQPATSMDIPDVKWGGECRVELRMTAKYVNEGRVQVEGNAKLFEGVTENNNDLEDEQVFTFTVPRGGVPSHHIVQLRSVGAGGGDSARIGISLTNSIIEEP